MAATTITKTTAISLTLAIALMIGAVSITWRTAGLLFEIRGELSEINRRLDDLANDRWYFQYQVEFTRVLQENNPQINVPSPYDVRSCVGRDR